MKPPIHIGNKTRLLFFQTVHMSCFDLSPAPFGSFLGNTSSTETTAALLDDIFLQ